VITPLTLNAAQNKHPHPKLFTFSTPPQYQPKNLPVTAIAGRTHTITVHTNLLSLNNITLELPNDLTVTATRDRLIDNIKGSTSWIGHIEGKANSEVYLTARGKAISGVINIGKEVYEIRYTGPQIHEIIQLVLSKNPPTHPEGYTELEALTESINAPLLDHTALELQNSGTIVDIMIAYTASARNNAGGTTGIQAKIDNIIAIANQAYLNSNIDMQLNLVHSHEVTYKETGNLHNSLYALTDKNDGQMDSIHKLRDQYGADQVVLLSTDTTACGTAWTMTSPSAFFESHAFAVVKESCSLNYALAHELGHNHGNTHNIESTNISGSYFHSYGFRTCKTDGFHTIMAYPCTSGDRAIPHFSNPEKIYNNQATGTDTANTTLSSNKNLSIISRWRTSPTTDTNIPNSPSHLSSKTLSSSDIALSWADNSTNETGFRIDRSTDNINWKEIVTANSNTTTFSDAGRNASTTYYYRIRAYNSNGTSAYSNISNATTQKIVIDTTAPSKPTDLSATIKRNQQINLSWAPSYDSESGLRFYLVQRNGTTITITNNTYYTDKPSSGTYFYNIVAQDFSGNTSSSNIINITIEKTKQKGRNNN